ncbi:hypothetical protein SVAN01_07042 [Stagonosporopsis vannaccii]|nr:hypothetical protein SVAN01_07042 [Stagonosporopsis vannaccii]
MGSKHSTPSKAPRDLRALADQAALRINGQHANGGGPQQIAAAVINGKDPLVVMLRRNEQGRYAFDQEYYDRDKEYTREHDKQHKRKTREGQGVGVEGHVAQQRDQKIPAGLRGDGGQQVYASTGGIEGSGGKQVPNEAEGQGRQLGEGKGGGKNGARGSKGRVEADRDRRVFVRHKHQAFA